MKGQLFFLFLFWVINSPLLAQSNFEDSLRIEAKLMRLKASNHAVHQYVNFDVAKLLIGPGWASSSPAEARFKLNAKLQILLPWALFREQPIHIAYGIPVNKLAKGGSYLINKKAKKPTSTSSFF